MRYTPLHESIVVAVASRGAECAILSYVDMLTAHHSAQVSTVCLPAGDHFVVPWGASRDASGNGLIRTAIREASKTQRIGLIVSKWLPSPTDMQDVLRLANELRTSAVFVSNPQAKPRGRVLVATAGGPNVFRQMWVARETARAWGIPVHMLRIVYLATITKIARRMINPEVRQALLACHSPAQALDVLEPRAGNVGRTESGLPPYPRGAACETGELAEQLLRETLQR